MNVARRSLAGVPRLRGLSVLASFALHAGLGYCVLAQASAPTVEQQPESVQLEFTVSAPEPEPESEPAPQPEPEVKPLPAPQPPTPAPKPEAQPPAPAPLSGENLDSPSSDSFSVPVADGRSTSEPIRTPPVRAPLPTGTATSPAPRPSPPRPKPVEVVPLRSLAHKPKPPSLAASLAANFPPGARAQGIAGSARVRLRIEPSGVARVIAVQSESATGFGAACQRTVAGSRWSPPRDGDGRAVATLVTYVCQFRVDS